MEELDREMVMNMKEPEFTQDEEKVAKVRELMHTFKTSQDMNEKQKAYNELMTLLSQMKYYLACFEIQTNDEKEPVKFSPVILKNTDARSNKEVKYACCFFHEDDFDKVIPHADDDVKIVQKLCNIGFLVYTFGHNQNFDGVVFDANNADIAIGSNFFDAMKDYTDKRIEEDSKKEETK